MLKEISAAKFSRFNLGYNASSRSRGRDVKLARYELIEEPEGGWVIWDSVADGPAALGESALFGMPRERAAIICARLND